MNAQLVVQARQTTPVAVSRGRAVATENVKPTPEYDVQLSRRYTNQALSSGSQTEVEGRSATSSYVGIHAAKVDPDLSGG
jgi:uncharacterized protein YkwD